jgi:SAM-dependent methyltransferase
MPARQAPTVIASMPEKAIRALTGIRNAGLWALEPIDYAGRLINGKSHLPPLRIRRQAGPLAGLENSGVEFAGYLKLLCNLGPNSRLLDIGCGFGLLALQLENYLGESGRYVGVDVDRRAVGWAVRHISQSSPQFEFQHLDIRNHAYNPHGLLNPDEFRFPFEPSSFDTILLKSVFTHLRPEATRNYVSEIQRLLRPGGCCLSTFFVLDQVATAGFRPALEFKFGNGEWRYAMRNLPELAIAYSEESIGEMVAWAGLTIEAMHPGSWSGRPGGLSYQDLYVLKREAGHAPTGDR